MNEQLNNLPVLTWNHLGVNRAGQEFALPEVPQSGSAEENLTISILPSNVERVQEFPIDHEEMESGVGKAYDNYILKNSNISYLLKVKGETEQTIRTKTCVSSGHRAIAGSFGIYAEEGSSLVWMQESVSDEDVSGFSTELTRIYAKKNSRIRLIQVQNLNRSTPSWNGVAIYAEDGARVEVVRAVLGSSRSAFGTRAELKGKDSSYQLDSIYFADQTQLFDFNDVSNHYGKNTQADMYTAGVLAGESSKTLRGTIDFKKGAVYGVGHESEDVLMFGDKVRNRTVPLILCAEEQVEGQHAASIGRLDETQIYYLISRGLTPLQARMLLIEGRFAPVLDKIPDEKLREELASQIERRLKENEPKSNAS